LVKQYCEGRLEDSRISLRSIGLLAEMSLMFLQEARSSLAHFLARLRRTELTYRLASPWRWLAALATIACFALALCAAPVPSPPLPSLKLVRDWKTPGTVSALAWSSDGARLAALVRYPEQSIFGFTFPSAAGNRLSVWDPQGRAIREFQRPSAFFRIGEKLAFVAGNRQVVTPPMPAPSAFSVFDIESGDIRDVAGPNPDKPHSFNATARLAASPDQTIVAAAFYHEQPVALYSTRDWTKLADLPEAPKNPAEKPHALAFSNDGALLAVAISGTAQIYDVNTRRVVQRIDAFDEIFTADVVFSPDGSKLAVSAPSLYPHDPVRVFDRETGVRIATYSQERQVSSRIAWTPDGRFVVFITGWRTLRFWDPSAPTMRQRTIDLGGYATHFALSPDGRALAAGLDTGVKLFRVAP
jgi:WD40 repeat protein